MNVTIYDVAREAGVSIAAVSQVINGKGKISERRRREIVRVMERLNYRPSVIATALAGKRTYTIGLLVPDISNPFFAEIARSVEEQGHRLGYSLVICCTDNKEDRVERYLSLFRSKSVDGIVIGTGIGTDDKETIAPLAHGRIPIVTIARELPGCDGGTVVVDDFAGGRMAAGHLTALGHRRMAVLAESPKLSSSRERIRGFREGLGEAGVELPDAAVVTCGGQPPVAEGKRRASELLRSGDRPTAIFCCNDLLAIGTLQAAKEAGLSVPGDVSVVGFDNTILASVTDPPLTTVAQPIERMGQLAVDLLIRRLANETDEPPRTVLQPELVVRESTAAPAPSPI
ncbi:LacI family DNA-binding transcriptional regulator [Paenibacillus sp. GYB003]|uniref:LacI family DNA-binding transcriptional regulator n=1 Tax=Paenibacillus sp. GYB003 TaxID=2994392 RepID=UPI002F963CCB